MSEYADNAEASYRRAVASGPLVGDTWLHLVQFLANHKKPSKPPRIGKAYDELPHGSGEPGVGPGI